MKIRLLQTVPILTLIACVVHAGQPRVEITKNCPELRYLGRPATFEIAVANRGDGPALNVVVRDTVSGGVTFLSADSGGIRENADVVWQLGTLAPGQTRTLTTTMRCDRIGQVANTARVSYCAEAETACAFDIKSPPLGGNP